MLASWAIPNGIPPDPADNRLAVRTEDHPLEYLDFHGEIPQGEYGAGTMTIWDRGTYETAQVGGAQGRGDVPRRAADGRYGLFPIGEAGGFTGNDWMIHRMDPPADPGREPMPERIVPMMARAETELPRDEKNWSFEVKWDGVRAIAYVAARAAAAGEPQPQRDHRRLSRGPRADRRARDARGGAGR